MEVLLVVLGLVGLVLVLAQRPWRAGRHRRRARGRGEALVEHSRADEHHLPPAVPAPVVTDRGDGLPRIRRAELRASSGSAGTRSDVGDNRNSTIVYPPPPEVLPPLGQSGDGASGGTESASGEDRTGNVPRRHPAPDDNGRRAYRR